MRSPACAPCFKAPEPVCRTTICSQRCSKSKAGTSLAPHGWWKRTTLPSEGEVAPTTRRFARSFAQDPQVRGSMDFEQPLIDASRRSFNGGAGSLGGLAGGAGLRRYPGPGDNNGPSSVAQMIWTALTLPFSVASSLLLFLARVLRLRSLLPSLFGNGGGSQGSSASDPRTSAERFVRELEMETGGTTSRSGPPAGQDPQADGFDTGSSVLKRLPPFFIGSYTDALRQAKEQIKIPGHRAGEPASTADVDRFKQHTLTDNELVELLSRDDFIVWGGDVREREAYTVARTLQASTYPFVAFIALQPPRQSSRAAAASSGSSPRPAVLSRLEGSPSSATSAASIASHISDVLLPRTRVYMDRLRAERRRREMERELRAEQDRAYQEASRRDAERIAQRREEERRKAVEAQRRREEQEQKEELQRRQQIWRRWASNNLVPQEPGATHEAVRFSFRLPSGKTLARRFSPLDPVEAVFAYVESASVALEASEAEGEVSASVALEASEAEGEVRKPEGYEHTYRFSLVTGYPRKRIEFWRCGRLKAAGCGRTRSGRQPHCRGTRRSKLSPELPLWSALNALPVRVAWIAVVADGNGRQWAWDAAHDREVRLCEFGVLYAAPCAAVLEASCRMARMPNWEAVCCHSSKICFNFFFRENSALCSHKQVW
ncbi:hypothetical protein L1887_49071 [Cichorium endivia]|nr:hypothetical protein L1887_49071 [Cichorium endivia]